MKNIIEFDTVSKIYQEHQVLTDFNLAIREGEIFALVGSSGSGKTTSLKMINSLINPSSGQIRFEGKDIKDYDLQKLRWQIGYVLQQIALFPTMTVQENIAVIPEMLGWSKKKIREESEQLLAKVNLNPDEYLSRYPRELSGGEQQRIGILRALIAKPKLVLMDEPFSALDPLSRTALQDLVLELHKDLETTIIFVTHDMKEAIKLGDRIGVMNKGNLEQVGSPEEIVNHPATSFVKNIFQDKEDIKTVGNLVEAGYISKVPAGDESLVSLKTTTSLDQLYNILTEEEVVEIRNQVNQPLGLVNRVDVLNYLAHKNKKD